MNTQINHLAQADLLLLLADFWRAPEQTIDLFKELDDEDLRALIEVSGLAPQSGPPEALSTQQPVPEQQTANSNGGRAPWFDQLQLVITAQRQTSQREREAVYRELFDGRIGCPINEATFIRRDKGAILGDLCGFYRAFGWEHDATGERADHLLVELEFVAMLLVMAVRSENDEQRETTIAALAEFTRQHPNDWIALFCQQIRRSTVHEYFVAASHLLENVWNAMVDFHGWTIDTITTNPVGIGDELEDPYECGAPDLVTIGADQKLSDQ
jgi:TorA maturation chaperone TorD